jgi:HSP20 family protein
MIYCPRRRLAAPRALVDKEANMAMRDLIPWNRGRDVTVRRDEDASSFLTLHREMNRLFDDAFRGFGMTPFASGRIFDRQAAWPHIELSETDSEIKVSAELPGLEERDVEIELGKRNPRDQRREEDRNRR